MLHWGGFIAFILVMLALDLGVFHRRPHAVSIREALAWSLVWVGLAGVFAVGLAFTSGTERALEFATGYAMEKTLSVDNIFVFVVLFAALGVPAALQHRVLVWGVLGALVLRAAFIGAGAALLARFHWILYVFGGLLLFTALRMLLASTQPEADASRSPLYRLIRRVLPTTDGYRGSRFWVREGGRWLATPLLAALLLVEGTDVIFAVDSIPAIFAVTEDPFIVFTSNIFAILGLRSLYFLLSGVVGRFHYLKAGLALVLGFVGAKMLLVEVVKLPIALSLGVIIALVGGAIGASLLFPRREPALERVSDPG